MADFLKAIPYVFENEGGYSNDPADHGGATHFGITSAEARRHGFDVKALTLAQAQGIYLLNYWKFNGIKDQRVATKMLDMVVNFGIGMKLIQRVAGVKEDGVYGPQTEKAINALDPENAIERLSLVSGNQYISIALHDTSQLVFLRGWIARAIRRPR